MKKGYAVGAFNCPNMESVMAIIQAAEGNKFTSYIKLCRGCMEISISMEDIAPVMLQFAKSLCSSLCTFGSMVSLLKVVLKQYS